MRQHVHRTVCTLPCVIATSIRRDDRCTLVTTPVTLTVARWFTGWPRLDSIAQYTAGRRYPAYVPTATYGARWRTPDSLRGAGWANGVWWGYDRKRT